jgi:TolA-binding protein
VSSRRITSAALPIAAVAAAIGLAVSASAIADETEDARSPPTESQGAAADLAALKFYRSSIVTLGALAKRKEGKPEAPMYLSRLADADYKVAALSFRLAHSSAAGREGHADLTEYKSAMDQLVTVTTTLIDKYPKDAAVPRALFLRGQAEKELEKNVEGIRDFRALIDTYPGNDDMVSAQLSLYELFNRTKDYNTAIYYLKHYSVPKSEKYYPISLDHLAFAYFSINNIPEALKQLELELEVFPPPDAGAPPEAYSEREKILVNATLFYYTGIELKVPGYTVTDAVSYFDRLKPGPSSSKMAGHFANLLRSKGLDDELDVFKKALLASGAGAPELIEVLLASMENSLNKKRMDRLKVSTDELTGLFAKLTPEQRLAGKADKLSKLLGEASTQLNQTFLRAKGTPDEARVAPALIAIYSLMLKVSESEASREKIEFNMAEIFFGMKKYEAASIHYRWIADLHMPLEPEAQKLQRLARFKALTARYETLSEHKVFPKTLAPKPLEGAPETELPKEATQWIAWLDQYEKGPHEEPADTFEFEAIRLLYSSGQVKDALDRAHTLLTAYPKSNQVMAASLLILDTYLASEKWEEVGQLARDFLKTADPKNTEFRAKLAEAGSEATFKTIDALYKAGAFADALERADKFLALYPASKRRQACLTLAGNAALALKDRKRALTYFNPLLKEGTVGADAQSAALLTSASVAEDAHDFAAAVDAYRRYLALPSKSRALSPKELVQLRVKTLEYAWLSAQPSLLKATLNSQSICTPDVAEHCERFAALFSLSEAGRQNDSTATSHALDRALKGNGPARAIWAAAALENSKGVSFNNRIQLLGIVSAGWDKLEPLSRYSLLPRLTASIPATLRLSAAEIRGMSRLKLEKPSLDKRTLFIQRLEAGIEKVLDLPWQRIRAGALNELAGLYADFCADLSALPPPAGLAADDLKTYNQTIAELQGPFRKKADDLRKQALDGATDAAVEAVAYNPIAQAFAAEHTQAAGAQAPMLLSSVREPVAGIPMLASIGSPAAFRALATTAASSGNWGLLAFLVEEAKDKNLVSEAQLSALRGISLSLAGAQAESLAELKEAASHLDGPGKLHALAALAVAYSGARAQKRAKDAIEEFLSASDSASRRKVLTPGFARELAEGAPLAGADVSSDTIAELAAFAGANRTLASPAKRGRK